MTTMRSTPKITFAFALLATTSVALADKGGGPSTFNVRFTGVSNVACDGTPATKVYLTNSGTNAEKGNVSFNGGPGTAYDVAPGATTTVTILGGKLDCAKAPNLTGTAKTIQPATGTTVSQTLQADAVEYAKPSIPVAAGGTIYLSPKSTDGTSFKCGTPVKYSVLWKSAPQNASPVALKLTPWGQASTTITVSPDHPVEWAPVASLDCNQPLPTFAYEVGPQHGPINIVRVKYP